MIKAVLLGEDKLKQWIASRYPAIQGELQKSMGRLVIKLSRHIKEDKLSGQVLHNRTGTLRRSISPRVVGSGTTIIGEVGTNVIYAAIHEYGGTIVPKRAKWLRFQIDGNWVTTAKVVIPERSFMRTALSEMEPEIRAEFQNALSRVVLQK